jgi:hypothetical protein
VLTIRTHVTTLCNNQIYETLFERTQPLQAGQGTEREDAIRQACEQERQGLLERLKGFEVRRGVLIE